MPPMRAFAQPVGKTTTHSHTPGATSSGYLPVKSASPWVSPKAHRFLTEPGNWIAPSHTERKDFTSVQVEGNDQVGISVAIATSPQGLEVVIRQCASGPRAEGEVLSRAICAKEENAHEQFGE